MAELFRMTVMLGIFSRTAVSKSMPAMPTAVSPITLMHCLSGAASWAPKAKPRPVPNWVELPQPM